MWENCTIESGEPGGRVDIDPAGPDACRILSPKFRLTDGDGDYGVVGFGILLIEGGAE